MYFADTMEQETKEPVIGLICAAEFCGQPKFLPQHRDIGLSAVKCRTTVHVKPVGHELPEVREQLRGFPFVI